MRVWQATPVFLPGESHGQRSLVGYSSMELQRNTIEHASTSQLQGGLVREGGAALTFAPNGIPLELEQEM